MKYRVLSLVGTLTTLLVQGLAHGAPQLPPKTIQSPDGTAKLWYNVDLQYGITLTGLGTASSSTPPFEFRPGDIWSVTLRNPTTDATSILLPSSLGTSFSHSKTTSSFTATWSTAQYSVTVTAVGLDAPNS